MKKYTKELKEVPPIPFRGLTIDNPVDGGFVKAKNVDIINGEAVRRNPHIFVDDGTTVMASRGYKSMFEFRLSSGTKYILVDVDYDDSGDKLKVIGSTNNSTDEDLSVSAWSTPINALTTGDDVRPQYATGMDMAIRVDGTNDNKVFRDLTTPENCGITPPAVAPTLAGTTGGSLTVSNNYYVYYTYVKIVGDYEVESYPSPISLVLALGANTAINVTFTESSDTDTTHVRIYRNLAGNTDNFFEAIADITGDPGGAPSVAKLIASDADTRSATAMSIEAGKPPKCKYVAYAANRMWYANCVDDVKGNSKLAYTLDSQPENVPPLYFKLFDPYDGGEITGLGALRDSIIVFKRNKMWNVSLYDPFQQDVISRNMGCVDGRTITSLGSTNSLMWLSEEGVLSYDGGQITNVSEFRINNELEVFFRNGAEFHGYYHPEKKQYHLIMFYRNAGDTLISAHKHLVYNLRDDNWTEYEYTNSAGAVVFSTAINSATNVNKMELGIVATVASNGTTANLVQMYNLAGTEIAHEVLMASVAASYTATDESDYIYTISREDNDELYKITAPVTSSVIATELEIQTAIYNVVGSNPAGDPANITYEVKGLVCNRSTGVSYILITAMGQDAYTIGVVTVTVDGASITYAETHSSPNEFSDGEILFFNGSPLVIWNDYNETAETVDSFSGSTNIAQSEGSSVSFDGEYYFVPVILADTWDGTGTAHVLYKYDSDGFVASIFPEATSQYECVQTFSATKYYLVQSSLLCQADYANSVWTITAVPLDDSSIFTTINNLDHDLDDRLVASVYIASGQYRIYRYWAEIDEGAYFEDQWLNVSIDFYSTGYSFLDSGWIVGAKITTEYVYKAVEDVFFFYYPKWILAQFRKYVLDDEGKDMDYDGVVVELISARTNFGVPQKEKLFRRMIFDTVSQNCTSGVIYVEGDSTRMRYLHEDEETTTPSGAISGGGFASPGAEEWKTEYVLDAGDMFDSEVDNRDNHHVYVNMKGNNYRWSLKMGDAEASDPGNWKLKPPVTVFVMRNIKGEEEN